MSVKRRENEWEENGKTVGGQRERERGERERGGREREKEREREEDVRKERQMRRRKRRRRREMISRFLPPGWADNSDTTKWTCIYDEHYDDK